MVIYRQWLVVSLVIPRTPLLAPKSLLSQSEHQALLALNLPETARDRTAALWVGGHQGQLCLCHPAVPAVVSQPEAE